MDRASVSVTALRMDYLVSYGYRTMPLEKSFTVLLLFTFSTAILSCYLGIARAALTCQVGNPS